MKAFDEWWVSRFGRPPLPKDMRMFELCMDAFKLGKEERKSLTIEEKKEQLIEMGEDLILFDGYEDALIGVCHRFGREPIAIYDMDQCLESLMVEGVDYEQANEHFFSNTLGSWNGDMTPAFLRRFEE